MLREQGRLAEAILLFAEELEGCVARDGIQHEETRSSAKNLAELLHSAGRGNEADALAAKHGLDDDSEDEEDDSEDEEVDDEEV